MSHPLVGMIVLLSMECSEALETSKYYTEAATKTLKQRELKQAKVPYIV